MRWEKSGDGFLVFRIVPPAGPDVPTDRRAVVERAARELLRNLAGVTNPTPLRVADAEGGIACLIQVWSATEVMPTAGAERRRRTSGPRTACQQDIMEVLGGEAQPLTRKQLLRALRAAGKDHGAGTVAKALADLTKAGVLLNPRDRRGYRLPGWPRRRTPTLF